MTSMPAAQCLALDSDHSSISVHLRSSAVPVTQRSALSTQRSVPSSWLSIAELARRTGLTTRAWRKKAPALRCRGLAVQLRPARGRPGWWFDPAVMRADHRQRDTADFSDSHLARHVGPHRLERAEFKLRCVQRFERALADGAGSAAEIAHQISSMLRAEDRKVSARTLFAWRRAYRAGGIQALIDDFRAPIATKIGIELVARARSPKAIVYFYGLYRTQQRMPVSWCHARTLVEAGSKGWTWPQSVRSTQAWLSRNDNRSVSYLARHGWTRWMRKYGDFIEQDFSCLLPGQMYVADHKLLDMKIRDGRKVLRPWLTGVMDMASRCIVGWELCESPNQDTILAAVRRAFVNWAIPECLKIDNGKDYDSLPITGQTKHQRRSDRQQRCLAAREKEKPICDSPLWNGVLRELGCEVKFALPYNPQSKPIERFFGTFNTFAKTFASYCGNTPADRPEAHNDVLTSALSTQHSPLRSSRSLRSSSSQQSALITLDALRDECRVWMDQYHCTPHTGDGMTGLSPLDKWAQTSKTLRKADEPALRLLMQIRGAYRVGKNGVAVRIGGATIRYGRDNQVLRRYKGRDVLVAVDPQDLSYVCAFTDEGDRRVPLDDPICRANARIPPNASQEQVRAAIADLRRCNREERAVRGRAPAALRLLDAEVRRQQADAVRRVRATGTEDVRPLDETTAIRPVRTGFEDAVGRIERARSSAAVRLDSEDIIDLSDGTEPRRDLLLPLLSESQDTNHRAQPKRAVVLEEVPCG